MGIQAALLAISVIGTGGSIVQNRRAQKAGRRAEKAQARIAQAQVQRERIQQIRQARIRRASIIAASEASGTVGSSAESGATSSVQSQLSSNIGFLDKTQGLAQEASSARQRAANLRSSAGIFSAAGALASPFVDTKSIFKD